MKFKNQSELYFQRMDSSVDQKAELLSWIPGGSVAELGPGSGSLTELIAARDGVTEVLALDASPDAVARLAERFEDDPRVSFGESTLGEDSDPFGGRRFSAIVASSVFHEVFSFLDIGGLRLIAEQLTEALVPGGRFILRDGVKPDMPQRFARMEVAPRLIELAERYCAEGRLGLRPSLRGTTAYGSRHQIAEMAFTITWGGEAFQREVEEQYQLYSLQGAVDFYAEFGLKLIHGEAYTQQGYIDNLADSPMESLADGKDSWEPWFPATNALWVFEKPA